MGRNGAGKNYLYNFNLAGVLQMKSANCKMNKNLGNTPGSILLVESENLGNTPGSILLAESENLGNIPDSILLAESEKFLIHTNIHKFYLINNSR